MRTDVQILRRFGEQIESAAYDLGLEPYPVVFEVVSEKDMATALALAAMPTRYSHWSFGKAVEIAETEKNFFGFGAAEMVANANPSRALLLEGNPLSLQLLVMAHVMGHLDFMRRNRHFRKTEPETVFARMAQHRFHVGEIAQAVGEQRVEAIVNAAHAIRFARPFPSSPRFPSLLRLVAEHGEKLHVWERELLTIIDEETEYFAPQIETKILNEGWASFWQLRILDRVLRIDDPVRDAVRIEHARVVLRFPDAEQEGPLQPYLIGFRLFEDIERRWRRMASGTVLAEERWDGLSAEEKLFLVGRTESDATGAQTYLTEPLARRLGLYADEHAFPGGWQAFHGFFPKMLGLGAFPQFSIQSTDFQKKGWLFLEHQEDGMRELDANETQWTLIQLQRLWRSSVLLRSGKWLYHADEEGVKITQIPGANQASSL